MKKLLLLLLLFSTSVDAAISANSTRLFDPTNNRFFSISSFGVTVDDPYTRTMSTTVATSANQTTEITNLASILSALQGPLAVTGTFWQATQPVSASALPLPTGASTSALQTTGNTALTTINTTLGSPMQQTGGSVTANPVSVSSATLTSVANSITTGTLLASNASRKGAIFYNDSSTNCNIAFAATASSTSYSIKLAAGSHYEMETRPLYTGAIAVICDLASGSIRATEF